MGLYRQSVIMGVVDAIRVVGLASDAVISEVANDKICVLLSDVLFD